MPANRTDAIIAGVLVFALGFIVGRAFFESLPLPLDVTQVAPIAAGMRSIPKPATLTARHTRTEARQ
ncbi:MAG: hypothetical protein ACOY3N_23155 [Bradyrhizobium sp.]|uniref:hypothetical protein n=1 Tax=Bradyrhizobium sp. TaxID=376 RepID=UPI003BF0F740